MSVQFRTPASVQVSFTCTVEDIDGEWDEPDWRVEARCASCPVAFWTDDPFEDPSFWFRVDEHEAAGHPMILHADDYILPHLAETRSAQR